MLPIEQLTQQIRQGRSVTASIVPSHEGEDGGYILTGSDNMAGISEFWECLKTTPASRLPQCAQMLLAPPGQTIPEVNVFKPPSGFEVKIKPDWLWFAFGFIAGWIIT